MKHNNDSEVVGYMREWASRGGVIEEQYMTARSYYRNGSLSQPVMRSLEAVQNYLLQTGGSVLRYDGERYHDSLNDFFSGSGIGEASDSSSTPLRGSIVVVNGEWRD